MIGKMARKLFTMADSRCIDGWRRHSVSNRAYLESGEARILSCLAPRGGETWLQDGNATGRLAPEVTCRSA